MPRDVIEAALSAFDARHPGVNVLGLVDDSRESGGNRTQPGEYVLRFGNGAETVVAKVTPKDDLLQLAVSVEPFEDLTLALEQFVPSLRLVRRDAMPAVFEEVHRGFVSIVGTRPGGSSPQWCTAWMRI
ncbi:MAG: hypothetical protein JWM02_3537 [Frankiales bacterium]|nr:hypothetical protein [Frankiales bacterium]